MDLERLSQLLSSNDPDTRAQAAQKAGESADPATARPIAARLRIEPEAKVRQALISALAKLNTPEAINAIRGQATDPDPRNRCRVLETLYRAQDQTVFPLAVRMLSDLDAEVKNMAFQVVRKLGREGVMTIIQKMLSSDDVRWKVYAVAALGQVASGDGVALLAKCLTHETPEVRLQARASLVNLAKHGNDAASRALAEAGGGTAGDMNATFVNSPLNAVRPAPQGGNETLMIAPPGLGRPGPSAPTAAPSRPAMPSASSLAGPPPTGQVSGSQIAKRPTAVGPPGTKPSFVPLDEESMKIRTGAPEPDKPPQRRYSTAKYKALFGESMPAIMRPPPPEPEPAPQPEVTDAEAADGAEGDAEGSGEDETTVGGVEMEKKVELSPEQEAERKKKSKHWKDNICRDCIHIKNVRPDKQKMAQGRGWCPLVRKEVKWTYSCARGKW